MLLFSTSLFWAGLVLPGYAFVRRFDARALAGGGLSSIACSYLASFALLTPVSVACYLFELPLAVLSTAIVAAAVVAAVDLARTLRPSWPAVRTFGLGTLVALVVAVDLWMGARAGTHMGGDAGYHIGRVRMLLDHGFNSWDPLIAGPRLDTVYHTNLYHALLASCAQLGGLRAAEAWLCAWPFAKLVVVAGIYHLSLSVLAERWLAYAAAFVTLVWVAPYSVLPYPNTLAPYWVLPMGLAFGVDAMLAPRGLRTAAWIGASSLVIAQVHALNAVFLALAVGPCLAALLVVRRMRRQPGTRALALALLGLVLGLLWVAVPAMPRVEAAWKRFATHSATNGASSEAASPTAADAEPQDETPVASPARYAKVRNRYAQLFVLTLVAVALLRSRRFLPVLGFLLPVCAAMFVPPLARFLAQAAGAQWVLERFILVPAVLALALVPAGAYFLLTSVATRWFPLLVWRGLCAALTLAYAYTHGVDSNAWTRAKYVASVRSNRCADQAVGAQRQGHHFDQVVPPGATIAAPLNYDYRVVAHCNCYLIAPLPSRGSRGLRDMAERREAMTAFYGGNTKPSERLAILRRYDVRYAYAANSRQARLITKGLRKHIEKVVRGERSSARIVVFDLYDGR